MEGIISGKKAGGSYKHRNKHLPGSCGADKDTVPKKSGKSGKRNNKHPIKIIFCFVDNIDFIGE